MATRLYDIDASMTRVTKLKSAIDTQEKYVSTLLQQDRSKAEYNLTILKDMLVVAEKTHVIITEVMLAMAETSSKLLN